MFNYDYDGVTSDSLFEAGYYRKKNKQEHEKMDATRLLAITMGLIGDQLSAMNVDPPKMEQEPVVAEAELKEPEQSAPSVDSLSPSETDPVADCAASSTQTDSIISDNDQNTVDSEINADAVQVQTQSDDKSRQMAGSQISKENNTESEKPNESAVCTSALIDRLESIYLLENACGDIPKEHIAHVLFIKEYMSGLSYEGFLCLFLKCMEYYYTLPPEVFFYYHSIYTLDNAEKYIRFFAQTPFNSDMYAFQFYNAIYRALQDDYYRRTGRDPRSVVIQLSRKDGQKHRVHRSKE